MKGTYKLFADQDGVGARGFKHPVQGSLPIEAVVVLMNKSWGWLWCHWAKSSDIPSAWICWEFVFLSHWEGDSLSTVLIAALALEVSSSCVLLDFAWIFQDLVLHWILLGRSLSFLQMCLPEIWAGTWCLGFVPLLLFPYLDGNIIGKQANIPTPLNYYLYCLCKWLF